MPSFEENTAFWVLICSCLIGLAAAFVMRMSEGSSSHSLCTWIFYGCLFLVGLSAIFFLQAPSGMGLYAGITLGTMVVTATKIGIDNDVILDGEGNLTVNGNDDHPLVEVPEGVTAQLRGFGVTGGTGWDTTGIYNAGTLGGCR